MSDSPTRTGATIQALRAIPRDKLGTKIKKTILGVAVAGLGIYVLVTANGSTIWRGSGIGLCLLGATIWSGELVTAPAKLLGTLVIDLYRRFKGEPSDGREGGGAGTG